MKREGSLQSILQYAKGFDHHESILHDDLIESSGHRGSLQQINDMVSSTSSRSCISNNCNIISSRSSCIDRCSSSHDTLTVSRSARHKDDGDIDSAAEYIMDCDDADADDDAEGGGGDGADDIDDGDQDQQEQLSPNTVLNNEVINASTPTNSSTSTVNARRHHEESDHFAWAMSTAISAAARGANYANYNYARSSTDYFRHDRHHASEINDYIDEAAKIMKTKKKSKKKLMKQPRSIFWSDSCALIHRSAASHHPFPPPPPPNFCITSTFTGTSCAHVYTNRRKRSMIKPRRSPIL
jgi:hypothetical protein